jgi:hypothetical protein
VGGDASLLGYSVMMAAVCIQETWHRRLVELGRDSVRRLGRNCKDTTPLKV